MLYTKLLEIEAGQISRDEYLLILASLISSGDIWKLPTTYLDAAAYLFEQGILKADPEWKRKQH